MRELKLLEECQYCDMSLELTEHQTECLTHPQILKRVGGQIESNQDREAIYPPLAGVGREKAWSLSPSRRRNIKHSLPQPAAGFGSGAWSSCLRILVTALQIGSAVVNRLSRRCKLPRLPLVREELDTAEHAIHDALGQVQKARIPEKMTTNITHTPPLDTVIAGVGQSLSELWVATNNQFHQVLIRSPRSILDDFAGWDLLAISWFSEETYEA